MCCHDPLGLHGPVRFPRLGREPEDCCHTHAETLPAQGHHMGEPPEPRRSWTAQSQAQEDKLVHDIAETQEALRRSEQPEGVHRHGYR